MQTTTFINSQKLGTGKTMFCERLAAEGDVDGPVVLIETGPQGSLIT